MPLLTKSRLRLSWCVLMGCVTIASVVPRISLHDPRIADRVDTSWVHFVVYAALATLPLLGWKLRTGVALISGTTILSVLLQAVRGVVSGREIDFHGTIINLLGVVSGILLGLNILSLRIRAKYRPGLLADRSKSRPQ